MQNEIVINEDVDTGVVPRFTSQYCCTRLKSKLDATNPYRDKLRTILPFAIDEKGNILNKTSRPKIIKVGKINIDEQIQSFKDDVDIYTILERVVLSGDMTLLNQKQVYFEDIYDIPDNIHEVNSLVKKLNTQEVKDAINKLTSNTDIAKTDLSSLIQQEVAKAFANLKGVDFNGEASKS